MTRPRLYISYDPPAGRLSAVEFGRVDDGQPDERWEGVGDSVGILYDDPDGDPVGFVVVDLGDYDVDDPEYAELWEVPRFDVPALGLTDVPPNAIVVATRALYGDTRSLNRDLFSAACDVKGHPALRRWLACLQSGDSMAHFALGYTLYELGRIPEAYRHLRHYCELSPGEAWNWCWLGRAAAAMGEIAEAVDAFERAIDLEDADEPTDAAELLERLRQGDVDVPELAPEGPPAWRPHLAELLDEIGLEYQSGSSDDHGLVVFDTPSGAAWMEYFVGIAAIVRADVGFVDDDTPEGLALDDGVAFDRFVALGGDVADHVSLHDGKVIITVELDASFGSLIARGLRYAIEGVAAEAVRVRELYAAAGHKALVEPCDFEDWDLREE